MASSRLSLTKLSISFSSILISNAFASLLSFIPLAPCLSRGRLQKKNGARAISFIRTLPNNTIHAHSYKGVLFLGKDDTLIFVVSLVINQKTPIWRRDYFTLGSQTLKRLKSIPQPPKMPRSTRMKAAGLTPLHFWQVNLVQLCA
jgi:hypothetical protein